MNYDASPDETAFRYANISYDRDLMKIELHEFERREGDERFDKRTYLALFQEVMPSKAKLTSIIPVSTSIENCLYCRVWSMPKGVHE